MFYSQAIGLFATFLWYVTRQCEDGLYRRTMGSTRGCCNVIFLGIALPIGVLVCVFSLNYEIQKDSLAIQ